MLIAEISAQGIALWITGLATAIMGAYALLRLTIRREHSADMKARLDDDEAAAAYWRRQYDLKVSADGAFMVRVTEQIKDLYAKCKTVEDAHVLCRQEHAAAVGELGILRRQNVQQEERIQRLEKELEGIES